MPFPPLDEADQRFLTIVKESKGDGSVSEEIRVNSLIIGHVFIANLAAHDDEMRQLCESQQLDSHWLQELMKYFDVTFEPESDVSYKVFPLFCAMAFLMELKEHQKEQESWIESTLYWFNEAIILSSTTPEFLLLACAYFYIANYYSEQSDLETAYQFYYQGCKSFFEAKHLESSSEERINQLTDEMGITKLLEIFFRAFNHVSSVTNWVVAEEHLVQLGRGFFAEGDSPFSQADFDYIKTSLGRGI